MHGCPLEAKQSLTLLHQVHIVRLFPVLPLENHHHLYWLYRHSYLGHKYYVLHLILNSHYWQASTVFQFAIVARFFIDLTDCVKVYNKGFVNPKKKSFVQLPFVLS